ncbi:hypothetical protein SAMN05192533_10886 [Mesobacillus persicus]|uniref:Uncharacterized protein n=1 Tax=Mesobacillus persicus TaxID=930146 RepID=A0A1H8D7P1_9BACI|nr:hypothetical protein [Mesobacillus persicus]SEN02497.1 hypothetical protein SAMN05192533_10886 [Mesobacillus persicus]
MDTVLTYLFSLIAIMVAVLVTIHFKYELERMFRETKEVVAFHICNVMIVLMTAYIVHAVTTIYIFGKEFNYLLPIFILLLMILPTYIIGHNLYKKYRFMNRKYSVLENGKVLLINEKYLRRR